MKPAPLGQETSLKGVFRFAYQLLRNPRRHITGALARSEDRTFLVPPRHSAAACFCATGALRRATGRYKLFQQANDKLATALGDKIWTVNDFDFISGRKRILKALRELSE